MPGMGGMGGMNTSTAHAEEETLCNRNVLDRQTGKQIANKSAENNDKYGNNRPGIGPGIGLIKNTDHIFENIEDTQIDNIIE